MNTSFVYDKNKFSEADTVSGPHLLIKNEKAAGPLGLVSEIVKSTVQAGVLLVTDIMNQMIIEGVIQAE